MGPEFYVLILLVVLALAHNPGPTVAPGRAGDSQDMAALARRDQAALGRLYDRYCRLVFSLALRVTEDRGAAEEVTQDVFLQLWRRAADFDP
ncbi:MAG: sigma factor, partial [Burkholderiales bacterium]